MYLIVLDGTNKTFDVILKSLGGVMIDASSSFSGYLLPSVGCVAAGCGGTMAVCKSYNMRLVIEIIFFSLAHSLQ